MLRSSASALADAEFLKPLYEDLMRPLGKEEARRIYARARAALSLNVDDTSIRSSRAVRRSAFTIVLTSEKLKDHGGS